MDSERAQQWLRAAPVVFVLIWSTGFVVARLGMPHAPPFTFLSWRYALSVALFALWVYFSSARLPRDPWQWLHLGVAGVLMHAGYLGGVWAAVKDGISAGLVALLVGLQPILTALWVAGVARSEVLVRRQWAGLVLGLIGVLVVVYPKLGAGELSVSNLLLALLALVSITAGALYQKRWVAAGDVRASNLVQLAAAFVVTAPLAWAFENEPIVLHPEFIIAMAWSVLVLTLGGSSLLVMLIQRGGATRVASLFYLVPPLTAMLAWALFDELLTPLVFVGLALAAWGMAWVVRVPRAQPVPVMASKP